MAYDEELAHRIREQFGARDGVSERSMFGGLAFLLHGNMAVGVTNGVDIAVPREEVAAYACDPDNATACT